MEIRTTTIGTETYRTVVFAENVPSPFHKGCTEKWELWDEKMPEGYGYRMFCTVYDAAGNELYTDHGETYEIYHYYKNSKASLIYATVGDKKVWDAGYKAKDGNYTYLWKQLRKAYKALGITNYNIDMEGF